MSNALVQISPVEQTTSGDPLVRATLGGSLGGEDLTLLKSWADGLHGAIKEAGTAKNNGKCVRVLIDLSSFETYTDPQVLTVLADLMKQDDKYVYRTATWGGNALHVMIENVIRTLAGRDNLKNFKLQEEAMKWLEV
jgi:hypothetical protein